jgi:hypothetical protein
MPRAASATARAGGTIRTGPTVETRSGMRAVR